jgi:surface antigen
LGRSLSVLGRAVSLAALLAAGGISGGCSMSYKLGSLFDRNKGDASDVTGSISAPNSAKAQPSRTAMAADLEEGDLALARLAAADLLERDSKDSSQPWENPQTGARGMVTPVAATYADGGLVCRDFLASYVRDKTETWLQGDACKFGSGKWEVRNMRPWKRS